MRTHKKLAVLISVVATLGIIGTAIAGYITYTPIDDVSITSHNNGDIVFAGHDYTLTCTTSTDKDCDDEGEIVNDPVTHTWSGPGSFDPTTGTSVTWTAPSTTGNATITVVANDSPLANDSPKCDDVVLTVQNIIYVDKDATAGNDDGTTWANAFLKLQDALDIATSGNEIWVAEGTYKPSKKTDPNNSRTATFQLVSGVEVYGGFDPGSGDDTWSERDYVNNETILCGDIGTADDISDNSYNVVNGSYTDSNTTLDGFTITGGNANGLYYPPCSGGGMYTLLGSPAVSNCIFTGNFAHYGAGMSNWTNSNSIVTNCVFIYNEADDGGTYDNDCGGGIYGHGCDDLTLVNCVFYRNDSTGQGGGIAITSCDEFKAINCVISENSAYKGGGVKNLGSETAEFTNCTFTRNSATYGGGMYSALTITPKLTNCIFWDNSASGPGDEIYNYSAGTDPNFSYCDIEGGINGSKCGGYDSTDGGGNINSYPNFLKPDDPNGLDDKFFTTDDGLGLGLVSPCIDAGDNDAVSESNDIIGTSRKINDPNTTDTGNGTSPIVDMGAYEYDPDVSHHKVIYVDKNRTGGNKDGTSWTDAFVDLQSALDVAYCGDEIWVAEGTYKPSKKRVSGDSRTATFRLLHDVELYGGFAGSETSRSQRNWNTNETILSGDIGTIDDADDNSYNVVYSSQCASDTVLDGFTVTGGNANGTGYPAQCGGGICNWYSSPTITNCLVKDNLGLYAGGMANWGNSSNVTNCLFTGNRADDGTGFDDECGAGMFNYQSYIIVKNCVFSENQADGGNDSYGAGVANVFGEPIFINCLFCNNSANRVAGGMYNGGSNPELINCTFSGNSAKYGGAIENEGSDPVITNCIFWDNTATTSGGEIYNWTADANPTFSYCDIEGGINGTKCAGYDSIDGGGNINSDPDFVDDTDPDGNDDEWMTSDDGLALDSGSPCIDEGDNSAISEPNDITGATRKVDGDGDQTVTVDMGAYENQGS